MQIYIIKLCTRQKIVAAKTHGSVAANGPNEALALLIAIDIIWELSILEECPQFQSADGSELW